MIAGRARPTRVAPVDVARAVVPVASVLVVVALWHLATSDRSSIFFPPPADIGRVLDDDYLRGDLIGDAVWPSVWRMLQGWVLAIVGGVAAGVVLGLRPVLRQWVDPIIQFARAIPPPALLGVMLVAFGVGDGPKSLLIAFGSVWPILFNTIDGVETVDPVQLETARVFGTSTPDRLLRIVLPSASPKIFAGLRTSASIALVLMIVTEFQAATDGLGYTILASQRLFAMTDMWAALVVVALLGLVVTSGLLAVERVVLRWHRGASGVGDG